MKTKQTVAALMAGIVAVIGLAGASVVPAFAAQPQCGGVKTSVISCSQTGGSTPQDTGVWGLLILVINILTAGIGIAAVAGIVYGSILIASAGSSPDQIKKGREAIINVVIGLVAYALMYAFLNFLIPGGLFNKP